MLKEHLSTYYFDQNYNCAESLLRAANDYYDLGIEDRDMLLVGGYGAGMQTGNTCGAVLAAISVLSLTFIEQKAHESADIKPRVSFFLRRFEEKLGKGILCSDLKSEFFQPEKRCLATVEAACDVLEEVMNESVVSVETMRKSDAWTIEHKVPSPELMRRAGEAIFRAVDWKPPVAIVCGKGNNAGDGYVVASLLKDAGMDPTVILTSEKFSADGRHYYQVCREKGISIETYTKNTDLNRYGTILDCLLGTGFSGEVQGSMQEVIQKINQSPAYVVSADINSGLNGDTGEGSVYVRSDLTVSIGAYKYGHFLGKSREAMGRIVNADIGIVLPS